MPDNHPIRIKARNRYKEALKTYEEQWSFIKEKYNKPGNVYLGLVHRLDRPVGGVMVFAKTSKAASRLSNQVREKVFKKKYLAVVDGKIEKQKGTLEDYLYKDERNNISKVVNKDKKSSLSTNVELIETITSSELEKLFSKYKSTTELLKSLKSSKNSLIELNNIRVPDVDPDIEKFIKAVKEAKDFFYGF